MADQRYVDFLNKLIYGTKNKQIHWKYLDTNKELYIGMEWTKTSNEYSLFSGNKEKIIPNFNREDSFYTREKGTFIVIYVLGNQPARLYVVPETYKKIITLTPDEYGEHITRLLNLVQSQFPSADAFIDDFLNNKNEQ